MHRYLIVVIGVVLSFGVSSCGRTTAGDAAPDADVEALGAPPVFLAFDTPPVLTNFVSPTYPLEAKTQGLEGTVNVKILVGLKGTVERVEVIRSTNSVFDEAALEAARQFRFRPAELRGKATEAHVVVPIEFRLGS